MQDLIIFYIENKWKITVFTITNMDYIELKCEY